MLLEVYRGKEETTGNYYLIGGYVPGIRVEDPPACFGLSFLATLHLI